MNTKTVLKIFILIFLPSILFAQAKQETYYPFNQVTFSVTPSLCSNLSITNTGGTQIFNSKPSFGGEIDICYYQSIVKGFGISIGIGINSTPHSFKFSFVPNVMDPVNQFYQKVIKEKRYYPMGMIDVPLALSMIIPIQSSSWSINIHIGAKFNYLFNSEDLRLLYISDKTIVETSLMDVETIKEISYYWIESKIDKRFLFSYFIKAGTTYTTKRNDGIFFNIVANYSPQKPLTGNYMIHAVDGDNYGNFKQNINFLGLEIGYALSLCKKR